jgi:hypothetical protein
MIVAIEIVLFMVLLFQSLLESRDRLGCVHAQYPRSKDLQHELRNLQQRKSIRTAFPTEP